MKEQIKKILIEREGYHTRSAEITANDLLEIKDAIIKDAFYKWFDTGVKENVVKGEYSTDSLMNNFSMKYPAALIWLEWFLINPKEATDSIKY